MICKYCGFNVPENDRFCSNCGADLYAAEAPAAAALVNEPVQNAGGEYAQNNTAYGYYADNQAGYYANNQQNGGYYAGAPAGNPQGYWAPPVNDKAPPLKDYLKWILLYPLLNFIPGIGFIVYIALCIKNAADNTYTARSNFFKAMLISQAIGFGIAIVFFVVMMVITTVAGVALFDEMDPSVFMDEFYYDAYDFLSLAFMR